MIRRKLVYVLIIYYLREEGADITSVEGVYGNKKIANATKRDYEEHSNGGIRCELKEFYVRN